MDAAPLRYTIYIIFVPAPECACETGFAFVASLETEDEITFKLFSPLSLDLLRKFILCCLPLANTAFVEVAQRMAAKRNTSCSEPAMRFGTMLLFVVVVFFLWHDKM